MKALLLASALVALPAVAHAGLLAQYSTDGGATVVVQPIHNDFASQVTEALFAAEFYCIREFIERHRISSNFRVAGSISLVSSSA